MMLSANSTKPFVLLAFVVPFVSVVGVALLVSSIFFPLASSGLSFDSSAHQFERRCAGCHSVVSGQIGGLGPNLSSIGSDAGSRVASLSAEEYILESILYPARYRDEKHGYMPEGTAVDLPARDIRGLVAYLMSMNGVVNIDTIEALKVELPNSVRKQFLTSVEEIDRGKHLFFNELGCAACHGVLGLPGSNLKAPSLAKAGVFSEEYILNSIRTPDSEIANVWRTAEIESRDGTSLVGRVLEENGDFLSLLTKKRTGQALYRVEKIQLVEGVSVSYSGKSPMPSYTLTIRDERALVAFLSTLTAEL